MKKFFQRGLAVLLAAVLLFGAAPLSGFAGLDWPDWHLPQLSVLFTTKAKAAESYTSGYYTYTVSDNTVTITQCDTAASGAIVVPDTIGENSVVAIANSAFNKCNLITSVKLPDSLRTLGNYAFQNCATLSSVDLGHGIQTIGYMVFKGDEKLTTISIPASLNSSNLYHSYSTLDYITLYPNTDFEGKFNNIGAFGGSFIKTAVIEDGATKVPENLFALDKQLQSVTFKDSVTSIHDYAFYNCTALNTGDVYFYGTQEDWNSITIGNQNKPLLNATLHLMEDPSYTATFKLAGGQVNGSTADVVITAKAGDTLAAPVPTRENYTFAGWNPTPPATMPASNETYTARWTLVPVASHTVTFLVNDVVYASFSVVEGGSILAPDDPAKEGYTFSSWSKPGSTAKVTFPQTMGTSDVTYAANFTVNRYTLTWVVDGTVVYTQNLPYGAAISAYNYTPPAGKSFSGWDAVPETMPAHDLTVNGTNAEVIFTVVYTVNEIYYTTRRVGYGNTLPVVDYAVPTGYTFSGWRYDGPIYGNITVDATLEANVHWLTFYLQEGDAEPYDEYAMVYGEAMPEIEPPTMEGFLFIGWTPDLPKTVPDEDLVFYAVWEALPPAETYTLTFVLDNGDPDIVYDGLQAGDPITAPADSTKTGYTFTGWSPAVPAVMPAENLTFTANWQPDEAPHTHIPTTVTIPATCTTPGAVYTICAECGETLSDPTPIPPYGHDYQLSAHVDATCTAEGADTYTCTRCGKTYTDSIAKLPHTPQTVTIPATCTTDGAEYTICAECGETLSEATVIPALVHEYQGAVTKAASCTEEGVMTYTCTRCGDSYSEPIAKIPHTPGNWEMAAEPTETTPGKEVRKCTVCGTILEEREIPKLKVAVDANTGIEVVYDGAEYENDLNLKVEETFDGSALNLVNTQTGAAEQHVFDVTLLQNGVETQPVSRVKVKIPLPAGYDPNSTFIYHVNTETGKVEKMAATYEAPYMVFYTTHFSYYAIVEENNASIAIHNYRATRSEAYKTTITFTADATNAPAGAVIHWFVNDKDVGVGEQYTVKQATADYTVQCKLIKDGQVLAESATETVKVNTGFFAKIVAFFRGLFGSLPVLTQAIKEH